MNDDIRAQHDAMVDAYTQYLWDVFAFERAGRAWRKSDRVMLYGRCTVRLLVTPTEAVPVRRESGGMILCSI